MFTFNLNNYSLMNKMMMLLLIMISIMSISFYNNFMKWMMMEMFTLIFISMLNMNNFNKIPSLIYFSISSISGLILFFNLIIPMTYWNLYFMSNLIFNSFMYFMIQISLLMKIGIYPFYLWLTFSFSNLNWMSILIFSTLNKLIPIYILSSLTNLNQFMFMILIMNMIMMSIYMLNEFSIKKIYALISMNHSSYLIYFSYTNSNSFIFYLLLYLFNLYMIIYLFNKFNLKNKFNLINMLNNKNLNFWFIILMFNYNMFPPLSSFLYKWFFFYELIMINNNSLIYLYMLSISNMFMMWITLNLIKYNFLSIKIFKKNFLKFSNLKFSINFMTFMSIFMNSMFLFYLFIY